MGNPFKALKLANRATAKLLRGDLNADFKVTQQGLDAITQNLLTTQGSLGSALSGVNRRALNAMGRIANRDAAKLENIVGRGKSAVHTRYGAAIAGTPNLFGMSETIKGSQSKVNAKTLQAGELQAKGGNEAMAILQTAAETAASSGQYELAQALRDRGQAAEEVIAQNQADLASKRFDYRMQQKEQEKQQEEQTSTAAQESLLNMAMQPGANLTSMTSTASAMERTYNLTPGTLTDYVASLFDAEGKSTVAQPLVDENGNVVQTEVDDEDMTDLKQAAVQWLKDHPDTETPEQSRENFIASIVGVDEEGSTTVNGVPVHGSYAASVKEYAGQMWDAGAPAFYETQAAINQADQEFRDEANPVSMAAANFLGLDDGTVGLDTVITIGSFFLPWGKIASVGGKVLLGTGGRVASKVGARAAGETLMSAASKLGARATTSAAAKVAAAGTVEGAAAKGGIGATASAFEKVLAERAATTAAATGAETAATGTAKAGTSALADLVAQAQAQSGRTLVSEALKQEAAATAVKAGGTTWREAATRATAFNELSALSRAYGQPLVETAEQVAARTADAVVRAAVAEGANTSQVASLTTLLEWLQSPKNAQTWADMLARLSGGSGNLVITP